MSGGCGCGCGSSEAESMCGCCDGVRVRVPEARANRAGLSQIGYRIGTHGTFLASLTARLTTHELVTQSYPDGAATPVAVRTRPLAGLGARTDDATPALLDAWATVGDVLTFYQERIANEGFLRTARQRRSLHELAALPGYRPRPGLGASTYLAFDVDPLMADAVTIPAGSRSQSIPGQDELPQNFETSTDLAARGAWNRLPPRGSRPQVVADLLGTGLWLSGTTTRLKPGQPLLVAVAGARPEPFRILAVTERPDLDRTQLMLEPWVPVSKLTTALVEAAPNAPAIAGIRAALAKLDDSDAHAIEAVHALAQAMLRTRLSPPTRNWVNDVVATLEPRLPVEEFSSKTGDGQAGSQPAKGVVKDNADDDDQTWQRLLARPATPLASASLLPRDPKRELSESSGGTFALLAAANPQLALALAPAISGRAPDRAPQLRVYALRLTAGPFGRNFPRQAKTVRDELGTQVVPGNEWSIVDPEPTEREDEIALDGTYDAITPGSWLLIDGRAVASRSKRVGLTADVLVAQATEVFTKLARAAYGQSGECTEIVLDTPWLHYAAPDGETSPPEQPTEIKLMKVDAIDDSFRIIRRTTVYAASEPMALAEAPLADPVCDGTDGLDLDVFAIGLEPGRVIAIAGERADIPGIAGVMASEVAMIAAVDHRGGGDIARGYSTITLERPLAYCYRRDTLQIYGNVVHATHGQTRREPLGNGDAAKPGQAFVLKHAPVTWLPAVNPAGAASTVSVHVDDVAWTLAGGFIDRAPDARIYTESVRADGTTVIRFGDGVEGARLPSGTLNLDAVYREGLGSAGNLAATRIAQLADRPLGVRAVVNPVAATGGADPDPLERIRRNVPIASAALGRLVALHDYAEFARGFAGIEKAAAALLPVGRRRVVHVTLGGIDDSPIDLDSDLMKALAAAMLALGDPALPLHLDTRALRPLVISARVAIAADRRWERVSADARAALVAAFGWSARDFGQAAAASEVVATIQAVPGVARVDLDVFGVLPAISESVVPVPGEIAKGVAALKPGTELVAARPARLAGDGSVLPAEIVALLGDGTGTIALNQQPL